MISCSHWGIYEYSVWDDPIWNLKPSQIVSTVRGNCGVVHTFEEWQKCRACDTPKPIIPWWRLDIITA